MTAVQKYNSSEPQVVAHSMNLNDGLTIGSIPIIAGAGGAAIALLSVPFNVVTMLSLVLATFFVPMVLGMIDQNYAYSQTIAKVTKSKYYRLPRDKYLKVKAAVKTGQQVRIPLNKITDNVKDKHDTLVINGRNFSIENPNRTSDGHRWDGALDATTQVYSLENKQS
ncbi:MAG: hypothetical protein H9W81_03290 [Enterococcus sp.]|nr:hypothetical protein [Enterococcus sp.]